MDKPNNPVDPESTSSPLGDQRPSGGSDTAKPKDKIDLAVDRVFKQAQQTEKDLRDLDDARDAKAKEFKALGGVQGKPFTVASLPINPEMIEKVIALLKPGRMKVKEFQRGMNFFDTGELARVRKALIAAGVTVETAEGSVVFVTLTDEFAAD